jgi:hypothetical protein
MAPPNNELLLENAKLRELCEAQHVENEVLKIELAGFRRSTPIFTVAWRMLEDTHETLDDGRCHSQYLVEHIDGTRYLYDWVTNGHGVGMTCVSTAVLVH